MRETLRELAGELSVIHEALERAEVIERQLPAYLREIEAERDQLRAELIKVLRFVGGQATEDVSTAFLLNVSEEVSAVLAGMTQVTGELRAEVERLRTRGDDFRTEMVAAALERDEVKSHAADLRGALEGLRRYLPTYCKKADCCAGRCLDARMAHSKLEAAIEAVEAAREGKP